MRRAVQTAGNNPVRQRGGVAALVPTLVSISLRQIRVYSLSRPQHKSLELWGDLDTPYEGYRAHRTHHSIDYRERALSCCIPGQTSQSRRRGFGRSPDIRSRGIQPQFLKGFLRVVVPSSSSMEPCHTLVAFGARSGRFFKQPTRTVSSTTGISEQTTSTSHVFPVANVR